MLVLFTWLNLWTRLVHNKRPGTDLQLAVKIGTRPGTSGPALFSVVIYAGECIVTPALPYAGGASSLQNTEVADENDESHFRLPADYCRLGLKRVCYEGIFCNFTN